MSVTIHGNQHCVLLLNFLFSGYPNLSTTQSSYRDRVETELVYLPSQLQGAYTTTLYVMIDRVKGGGGACTSIVLQPSLAWANFSIIMECTPESGRCHALYSVV